MQRARSGLACVLDRQQVHEPPLAPVKYWKTGAPKVRFFFETPLGLMGICANQSPWRVSRAQDTTSTR